MTVLVTGASSGIGAATARAFADRGAHVLIHYGKNQRGASQVMHEIRAAGGNSTLLQGDLSCTHGVRRFAESVGGLEKPVEVLVNNAGSLIKRTPVLDFTDELWRQVMTLNLDSVFFLSQAVLPRMLEHKTGFIVNVSSLAARNGGGLGALAYSSAKGAVSTMTKALAKEFAPHGIRINAVSAGTIETNYHRTFSSPEALNTVSADTPMRRLGTPEEVADVIVFLCSPAARFIQGQIIEINGGFAMA